jgi:beta-carotene 15,15'-dioxygenase
MPATVTVSTGETWRADAKPFVNTVFARGLHRHAVISVFLFLMLLHSYAGPLDFLDWPAVTGLLIMLLGAPHGALDVAIASRRRHLVTSYRVTVFLLQYVGLVGLVIFMWWLTPGVSLAAFLVVSAYHFGGDWMPTGLHGARVILGLAILSATTLLHFEQVGTIFSWLAPSASAAMIVKSMSLGSPAALAAAGLVIAKRVANTTAVAVEFVVVLIAAVLLPPITFFVIYFCLLHSIRHLLQVRSELPQLNLQQLVSAGWHYAVLAVLGSLVGAAAFRHINIGPAFISSVFVTLAALTVPHIVLIDCVRSTRRHI